MDIPRYAACLGVSCPQRRPGIVLNNSFKLLIHLAQLLLGMVHDHSLEVPLCVLTSEQRIPALLLDGGRLIGTEVTSLSM